MLEYKASTNNSTFPLTGTYFLHVGIVSQLCYRNCHIFFGLVPIGMLFKIIH